MSHVSGLSGQICMSTSSLGVSTSSASLGVSTSSAAGTACCAGAVRASRRSICTLSGGIACATTMGAAASHDVPHLRAFSSASVGELRCDVQTGATVLSPAVRTGEPTAVASSGPIGTPSERALAADRAPGEERSEESGRAARSTATAGASRHSTLPMPMPMPMRCVRRHRTQVAPRRARSVVCECAAAWAHTSTEQLRTAQAGRRQQLRTALA